MGGTRKRIVLILCILALIPTPTTASSHPMDAQNYEIRLELLPAQNKVRGTTVISFTTKTTNEVKLVLDEDLTIDSLKINDIETSFDREGKKLIITPKEPLFGGGMIKIDYQGTLSEEVSGHGWAYMDNETAYSVYEASWYPLFEGDRATAEIRIKAPQGWTAVSNGVFWSVEDDNTFVWLVGTPEIGYSFAAGRYQQKGTYREHLTLNCYILAPNDRCDKTLLEVYTFFNETLSNYPYPKLSVAEVKGTLRGGHGDNSLIILSSEIIGGPGFDEFLAHEAAHSWFGGMVTTNDSKWLTEGFSTYAGVMFLESRDPRAAAKSLDSSRREYLKARADKDLLPILSHKDEYDELFHASIYSKGAYVLHMLRFIVGDETFLKTMRTYLESYEGGSASVEDYIQVVEEGHGENLSWFFDEWLKTDLLPDYWIESTGIREKNGSYEITARIRQTPEEFKMPVMISLRTEGETLDKTIWLEGNEAIANFQSREEPIYVEIDRENWILERNKANNRRNLHYPLNMDGLKLLVENLLSRLRDSLLI